MRQTLKDFEKIYNFFTRKDFVGDITDDYSPDMFVVVKKILSQDIVYMPSDNTVFVAKCINSTTYEVHLNTTIPGKVSVYQDTLKSTQWVKNNTPIRVFVSYIPVTCESTIYFAKKIGMKKTGVIPGGFTKNGKQLDLEILSAPVDKIIKELSWQQQ